MFSLSKFPSLIFVFLSRIWIELYNQVQTTLSCFSCFSLIVQFALFLSETSNFFRVADSIMLGNRR